MSLRQCSGSLCRCSSRSRMTRLCCPCSNSSFLRTLRWRFSNTRRRRSSTRKAKKRTRYVPNEGGGLQKHKPKPFAPFVDIPSRYRSASVLLASYRRRKASNNKQAALRRAARPSVFVREAEQKPKHVKYIRLEKRSNKGGSWGIVAKRDIRKHTVIALYMTQIKRARDVVDSTYAIGIDGHPSLTADLCAQSVLPPTSVGVPFWGHFLNEPSPDEQPNCAIELLHATPKVGGYALFSIFAAQKIREGEECTWCYGKSYASHRDYETSCE